MTQYSWIQCHECGWTGRTSELVQEGGEQQCPVCAKRSGSIEYPRPRMQDDREEVPPSAKLVLKLLEWEGPLTQQQLAEESLLSPRTVRDAVRRLEEVGAIEGQPDVFDARQTRYRLKQETPGESTSNKDS